MSYLVTGPYGMICGSAGREEPSEYKRKFDDYLKNFFDEGCNVQKQMLSRQFREDSIDYYKSVIPADVEYESVNIFRHWDHDEQYYIFKYKDKFYKVGMYKGDITSVESV